MTKPTKKEIENWQIDRFRESISDFPVGVLEAHEEPDFLVLSAERVVGIELTELLRPTRVGHQPLQEAESLRQRICSLAQSRFEAAGGLFHQVFVEFNSSARLTKNGVSDLADRVLARLRAGPSLHDAASRPGNCSDSGRGRLAMPTLTCGLGGP